MWHKIRYVVCNPENTGADVSGYEVGWGAVAEKAVGPRRVSVAAVLESAFSAQGVLTLYISAGILKPMLMDYIPIDFTAFLAAVLMLLIGREIVLSRQQARLPVQFCLAYGMYLGASILSLTYTMAPIDVATLKLFKVVMVDSFAVVATLFLITDTAKLEMFMKANICLALVVALFTIATAVPGQWHLAGVPGSNYISMGRVIGTALCFGAGAFGLTGLPEQAMAMVLVIGLLLMAGRGPLVAAFASLIVLMILEAKSLRKPRFTTLIALIVGAYVIVLLDSKGYFFTTKLRMASLITRTEDTSLNARMYFAESAAAMFWERPLFGWGLSSFPFYAGCADVRESPHNLALELLSEVGIVGFLPFVALLIMSFYRLHVRRGMPYPIARGLWCALVFWILLIPSLGLGASRAFLSLLASINAPITDHARMGDECIHSGTRLLTP